MSIRLGRSDLASAACGVSKPSAIAHVQQEKEAMESPYIADFERTDVNPQRKLLRTSNRRATILLNLVAKIVLQHNRHNSDLGRCPKSAKRSKADIDRALSPFAIL